MNGHWLEPTWGFNQLMFARMSIPMEVKNKSGGTVHQISLCFNLIMAGPTAPLAILRHFWNSQLIPAKKTLTYYYTCLTVARIATSSEDLVNHHMSCSLP